MKTTQKQIAEYAGVSERTVRNWSKDKQRRMAADLERGVNQKAAELVGQLYREIYKYIFITKNSAHAQVLTGALSLWIGEETVFNLVPLNERNLTLAIIKVREATYHG